MIIDKIIGKVTQKNIPWLGKIVDSLYTTLPILSIINFLSIITVLYATISKQLIRYVPFLNFINFLFCIALLTLFTMIMVYKFVLPSLWKFRGEQMMNENKKIDSLVEEIGKLRKAVEQSIQQEKG